MLVKSPILVQSLGLTLSRGRKVFLFEQLLYQPNDLKRHHDDGDRACTVGAVVF